MYLEKLEEASANQRIQFGIIFTPLASDLNTLSWGLRSTT